MNNWRVLNDRTADSTVVMELPHGVLVRTVTMMKSEMSGKMPSLAASEALVFVPGCRVSDLPGGRCTIATPSRSGLAEQFVMGTRAEPPKDGE